MELRLKFQALHERLSFVRSLALLRPAVAVKIDPLLVYYAFYFTLNSQGKVIYSTDQRVQTGPISIGT